MIYTSYFAKLKSLPENILPVSICAKPPYWFQGPQYKRLAPSYDLLMHWKAHHNEEYYIDQFYAEVLNKLSTRDVIIDLRAILLNNEDPLETEPKSICLLCYEKPTDFCHRHLVSEWMNNNGIECSEFVSHSIKNIKGR